MIHKLPLLGFVLVTASAGTALASDPHRSHDAPNRYQPAAYGAAGCDTARHTGNGNTGYGPVGYGTRSPQGYSVPPVARGGYVGSIAVDMRYADLDRNGWVSLPEALASARQVFDRSDRDRNRQLTRREVNAVALAHDDRNDDGRVTWPEHQRAVRAQFASYDRNRDGYLGRIELGLATPPTSRSAGWWR